MLQYMRRYFSPNSAHSGITVLALKSHSAAQGGGPFVHRVSLYSPPSVPGVRQALLWRRQPGELFVSSQGIWGKPPAVCGTLGLAERTRLVGTWLWGWWQRHARRSPGTGSARLVGIAGRSHAAGGESAEREKR